MNLILQVLKQFLQDLVDFFIYLIPFQRPSNSILKSAKIVAHRGWHNNKSVRENTLKSFELALNNHLWGIEFDIRWTKDLVPIVHHDADLKRLWDVDKFISELSFKELRSLCPEIPRLEEVVTQYGKRIVFFIEIKKEYFADIKQQKQTLERILSGLNPKEDYFLIGLDTQALMLFDNFEPSLFLLVGETNISQMSEDAIQFKCAGVMGHYLLCTDEILKKHRGSGQKIGTGFARTTNGVYRELNRGIDWIFTNHPWNLEEVLKLKND